MKTLAITILAGSAILIAGTMYFKAPEDSQVSPTNSRAQTEQQAGPEPEASVAVPDSRDQPNTDDQQTEAGESEEDWEAIHKAHAAHREQLDRIGYHPKEEFDNYEHYRTETLEELLNTGDTRAYPILLERYTEEGEVEKVVPAAQVAAIYGSTLAIATLAGRAAVGADVAIDTGNGDPMEHLIFSQALFRLASSLGDPYTERAARGSLERLDVELSEEQLKEVERVAEEVKDKLNSIRREKGLDPFQEASEPINEYHKNLMTVE